ncbi:MAG: nickel-dependent lactate racemase [Planctomycetota bacterium]
MEVSFRLGREQVGIVLPDGSPVYRSEFPAPDKPPEKAALDAVQDPIGSPPLRALLKQRGSGDVVVVVSDITRPVPYTDFLDALLGEIQAGGVARSEILLLVATGMHRPCTPEELKEMIGPAAAKYRLLNHDPTDDDELAELPGRSWAGSRVRINRRFAQAAFRIITGLVEPHFMAGFSGGRKAICPGIVDLETIRHFHGAEFMGDPNTRNARLEGNPCHEEALSVARMAGVDFSLNVVMNRERKMVRAFAGDLEEAHERGCRFVREHACRRVEQPADLVVTSSGGYPLDATFYQCVKGFVSALPAVRPDGRILAFGACSEGIGSDEYEELMAEYADRPQEFLEEIRRPDCWRKDQWELQMQCRTLEKVGRDGLHFVTPGLNEKQLAKLGLTAHGAAPDRPGAAVQEVLDELLQADATVSAFPEGPYCVPLPPEE